MGFLTILLATALIYFGSKLTIEWTFERRSIIATSTVKVGLGWVIGIPMMAWGVWLLLGEVNV